MTKRMFRIRFCLLVLELSLVSASAFGQDWEAKEPLPTARYSGRGARRGPAQARGGDLEDRRMRPAPHAGWERSGQGLDYELRVSGRDIWPADRCARGDRRIRKEDWGFGYSVSRIPNPESRPCLPSSAPERLRDLHFELLQRDHLG